MRLRLDSGNLGSALIYSIFPLSFRPPDFEYPKLPDPSEHSSAPSQLSESAAPTVTLPSHVPESLPRRITWPNCEPGGAIRNRTATVLGVGKKALEAPSFDRTEGTPAHSLRWPLRWTRVPNWYAITYHNPRKNIDMFAFEVPLHSAQLG